MPESSVLLGADSTGFVPNNTDGTVGTAFQNPAQYFDVLLTKPGATFVDMNVEIDKLTIDNSAAAFVLPNGFTFNTIIGVEQYSCFAFVDGTLQAGLVAQFGGRVQGYGTIKTPFYFNVAGQLMPGGPSEIGTFTIDGTYIQSSGGVLSVNVKSVNGVQTSDVLNITGQAVLGGTLFVSPTTGDKLKFGTSYTVLNAGSISGSFNTRLLTDAALLDVSSRVDGNSVIVEIGARRIEDVVLGSSGLRSMGSSLDTLRFSGRYAEFSNLFGILDSATWNTLGADYQLSSKVSMGCGLLQRA